nr:MAG TPA: hypothetical protein [Caudoviricetes sp.]
MYILYIFNISVCTYNVKSIFHFFVKKQLHKFVEQLLTVLKFTTVFLLTIRHFDESLFFSNFLFPYPFWSGKIQISY